MEETNSGFWDDAAAGVEAEHQARTAALAQAAVEPLLPYLVEAVNPSDLTQRVAMSEIGIVSALQRSLGEVTKEAKVQATSHLITLATEQAEPRWAAQRLAAVDDERPLPPNGFAENTKIVTEHGPGTVTMSTGRSIVIRLDNGETISMVNGTPGMDRLRQMNASLQTTAGWIDQARAVLDGGFKTVTDSGDETKQTWKSNGELGASNGGMVLDAFTASMLVQIHDALGPANQAKFAAMPLTKAVEVGWKLANRAKTGSVEGSLDERFSRTAGMADYADPKWTKEPVQVGDKVEAANPGGMETEGVVTSLEGRYPGTIEVTWSRELPDVARTDLGGPFGQKVYPGSFSLWRKTGSRTTAAADDKRALCSTCNERIYQRSDSDKWFHLVGGGFHTATPKEGSEYGPTATTATRKTAEGEAGMVQCQECDKYHPMYYSHEGRFGEGPIFAVVCDVDDLTSYYTSELMEPNVRAKSGWGRDGDYDPTGQKTGSAIASLRAEAAAMTIEDLGIYHDAPFARCKKCGQEAILSNGGRGAPVHTATGSGECGSKSAAFFNHPKSDVQQPHPGADARADQAKRERDREEAERRGQRPPARREISEVPTVRPAGTAVAALRAMAFNEDAFFQTLAVDESAQGTDRYQHTPDPTKPEWTFDWTGDDALVDAEQTQQGLAGSQPPKTPLKGLTDLSDVRKAAQRMLDEPLDMSRYTRMSSRRVTATRYCPTHKVYVGEGNQEQHDHCKVETRKAKEAADGFGEDPSGLTEDNAATGEPTGPASVQPVTTRPRVTPAAPVPSLAPTSVPEIAPGQMGAGGYSMTGPAATIGGGSFNTLTPGQAPDTAFDPLVPTTDQLVAAKVAQVAERIRMDDPSMAREASLQFAAQVVAKHPEMVKVNR